MDFLGVGPLELLFIILIIILVIGPRDIGNTARSIGRFLNRLYKSDEWRTLTQASKTIRTLPNRLAREAELEDLKEIRSSIEETGKEIEESSRELDKEVKALEQSSRELVEEAEDIGEGMKSWIAPPPSQNGSSDITDAERETTSITEEHTEAPKTNE